MFDYIPTDWTDPSGAVGLPTREASRTLEVKCSVFTFFFYLLIDWVVCSGRFRCPPSWDCTWKVSIWHIQVREQIYGLHEHLGSQCHKRWIHWVRPKKVPSKSIQVSVLSGCNKFAYNTCMHMHVYIIEWDLRIQWSSRLLSNRPSRTFLCSWNW